MAILILNLVKKTLKLHILTAVVKRDMKMGQIQAHFVDLNGIVKASGIELGFHEKWCFFEDFRTKMKASGIRKFLRIFSAKMKASGIDFRAFHEKLRTSNALAMPLKIMKCKNLLGCLHYGQLKMFSLKMLPKLFTSQMWTIVHICEHCSQCSHYHKWALWELFTVFRWPL